MNKTKKDSIKNEEWTAQDRRLIKQQEKKLTKIKTVSDARHYMHNAERMKEGRTKMIIMITVQKTRLIKAKLAMPDAELLYLRKSELMYSALFDNTSGFFTSPFDLLATWALQNTALSNAFTDIDNHIAGAEGDKITAMNDLKITLILALAYVNKLALLNQRQAVALITAAHMVVIGRGRHDAQEIEVKIGNASGEVIVKCMVPKEGTKQLVVTYFVEVSTDGGISFSPLDPSHPSKVVVKELAPNKSVKFRCRNWTKNGWSDWSVSKPITPY